MTEYKMTDYKMTDEKRKRLTEFLGECWHRATSMVTCSCGREGLFNAFIHALNMNRTFATDTDMLAVFRKIRDKGKWSEFYRFTGKHWLKDDDAWEREEPLEVWLFMGSYERACCLAADFWEEQG